MRLINKIQLASETAMTFVDELASFFNEEHSIDDIDNECLKFTDKYQEIFDKCYDNILGFIENNEEIFKN